MEQNTNNKNLLILIIIIILVIVGLCFKLISLLTVDTEKKQIPLTNTDVNEIIQETQEVLEKDNKVIINESEQDINQNETNISQPSQLLSSNDWKCGEFILNGIHYKLNTDYTNLTNNGWYVDFEKEEFTEGYTLDKNDRTHSQIGLQNDKYYDVSAAIGLKNLEDTPKDITECQFWSIYVNNKFSDTPVNFELPGGIKNGSTLQEIEAIYGKPDDMYTSDVFNYKQEDLKFTVYEYFNNNNIEYLSLKIYDDGGLMEFNMKIY